MDFISVGSIMIEMKWLVMIASLLLSLAILWLYKKNSYQKLILSSITDNLIIGFFVIKASLIVIEPYLVIRAPLSLLYFSGGEFGFWLAVLVASFFYFRTTRKKNVPFSKQMDAYFFYILYSFTIFHLINLIIAPNWEDIFNLVYSAIVFAWIFIKRNPIPYFSFTLGFAFYQIILTNLFENKNHFLGYKYWFYSIIILFLLFRKRVFQKNLE